MAMRKSIPMLATAAVVLPVGAVWAVTHSSSQHVAASTNNAAATATKHTTAAKHATPAPTAKKHATPTPVKHVAPARALTIQGPSVDMEWGPVQVTIIVKGKTVTGLTATAPTERARSAYINNIAVPMLRKEVLQAKTSANIKNIYGISGATMTSDAFYQSLLAALHTAHLD